MQRKAAPRYRGVGTSSTALPGPLRRGAHSIVARQPPSAYRSRSTLAATSQLVRQKQRELQLCVPVDLIVSGMTSQLSWNHYHRWSKLRDANLHASLQDPLTTTGGGRKQRALSSALHDAHVNTTHHLTSLIQHCYNTHQHASAPALTATLRHRRHGLAARASRHGGGRSRRDRRQVENIRRHDAAHRCNRRRSGGVWARGRGEFEVGGSVCVLPARRRVGGGRNGRHIR